MSGSQPKLSLKDEVNMRKANTERFMTPEERKDKYQRNLADSRKLTIIKRHLREKGYSIDDLYDSIIKDGLRGVVALAPPSDAPKKQEEPKIPVEVSLKGDAPKKTEPVKAEPPKAPKEEPKKDEPKKDEPKKQDSASLGGARATTPPVSYIPPKPKSDPVATRIVLNPWGQSSLF